MFVKENPDRKKNNKKIKKHFIHFELAADYYEEDLDLNLCNLRIITVN